MRISKYHVPIVGWIVTVVEWDRAYKAYWKQNDAFATKELDRAYGRTVDGFIVTIITLVLLSTLGVPLIFALLGIE